MQVTLLLMTVAINYRIILLMIFITSWCKPLKTDPSREIYMYLCHLNKAFFCQINTLINLYMSAHLENVQYCGVSLENENTVFLIIYLAAPKLTLILNDMLNKKNYMLKVMPLHPNLTINKCWGCFQTLFIINYHINLSRIKNIIYCSDLFLNFCFRYSLNKVPSFTGFAMSINMKLRNVAF